MTDNDEQDRVATGLSQRTVATVVFSIIGMVMLLMIVLGLLFAR